MSKQTINIGASPNDGTGTPLRTSFDYTNQNFTELYTALGGGVGLPGATTQVIFNDGGTNLAGDAGLVYNKTTDTLTAGNATITGAATVGTTLGVTGNLTVDTNTLFVNSSNDRVGIGTVSPNNTLTVRGSQDAGIEINSADSNMSRLIFAYDPANTRWYINSTLSGSGTTVPLAFLIQNSEVARFNTTGNLAFASGKGIDFSAVTGGTGTATANVLNDYEEGTWTGTLRGAVDPTIAVTTTNGRYTKVGRVVTVQIAFEIVTTTGASGAISISGLPFANNAGVRAIGTGGIFLGATFTGTMIAEITFSATSIAYYGINSNAAWSSADHNAGVGRYFWANVTYTV